MAPEIDGSDSDTDWVDGLKDRARRKRAKRPPTDRAQELPESEGNAVVAEIFPNRAAVRPDGAKDRVLCQYRMATLAFGGPTRERSPVCVGDRVKVEAGIITGRCLRRNVLARSAPNSRDPLLHAVAANLDHLVIVASAREPAFTPGIVDRFLVAAAAQDIQAILVVNKSDLLPPGGERPWSHYASAGAEIVETSALGGSGISELTALIKGRAAAFCGHSGVGKTSLLRRLLGDEKLGRIGTLSAATGMGKHTTTGAIMLPGPEDSAWIDTPGIMNFTLVGVEREKLLALFPDLARASARCGADCLHAQEPDCALRGMKRHQGYKDILASLRS